MEKDSINIEKCKKSSPMQFKHTKSMFSSDEKDQIEENESTSSTSEYQEVENGY